MQITTKTFNEEIDLNKFQIIPITSEMKAKYLAFKKYKEIIISGEEMNWDDAMNYAKKNRAVLPDINEAEDIINLVKDSGWIKYFNFWTREERSAYAAYHVRSSNGYISYYTIKSDYDDCVCLR